MTRNVPVELSTNIHKQFPKHLKVELKSQDINNHAFELSFKDVELDDSHEVVILSIFKEAQSELKSKAIIENGKAYFTFNTKYIHGKDTVTNYIYLKQGDKSYDITSFTFKVALSEIDKDNKEVAEFYDFQYGELLEDFEQQLKTYFDKLPSHVVINDEAVDLKDYVKWEEMPEDKDTIYDDTDVRAEIASKQGNLMAGRNIVIDEDNTISAIDTIQDLEPYAKKTDLPDLEPYATKAELPNLTPYALKSELPKLPDLKPYALKTDLPNLLPYAKKTDIPDTSKFITLNDIPIAEKYDDTAIKNQLAIKQDKLRAGNNIVINPLNNTISAVDTVPDLTPYAKKAEIPDTSQFITLANLPEIEGYDDTLIKGEIASKQDKLEAGDNIVIDGNTISASVPDTSDYITLADLPDVENYDDTEIREKLSNKQDKLEAGNNIIIEDNRISAIVPEIDLSSYALATDIPDTSEYITLEDLPDVENYDDTLIKQEIATKQGKLIAGENVTIEDNVITVKDTIQDLTPYALKEELPDTSQFITVNDLPEDKDTTYTAGDNIVIDENNVISSTASGGGGLEWITPTFLGNFSGSVQYAKDSNGYVYFKGELINPKGTGVSSVNTAFTMPNGYRPTRLDKDLYPLIKEENTPLSSEYITVRRLTGNVDTSRATHNNYRWTAQMEDLFYYAG